MKGSALKVYPGFSHGMCTVDKLEKPVDDRDDVDGFADVRDAGTQRADPAHIQPYSGPAAGRGMQGVDANTIWITEAWDSKASHDASLSLPEVKDAIAKGKPLIAGFGDSIVTTPVGGQGLGAQRPA